MAIDAAGLAVWERDLASGQSLWDERMFRLRGLEPDDPRAPADLRLSTVHPDDRARAEAAAAAVPESGETLDLQFRVIWPDGTVRWLHSRANRVRAADGTASRLIGTQWDITAAKQAELASQAKSDFLVRMSHDMRTPLNAVLGFAQLLANDPEQPLSESQLRSVRHIITCGEQLQGLIDRTSDLSLVESGDAAAALPAAPATAWPDPLSDAGRRWPAPREFDRSAAAPSPAVAMPPGLLCIDDDPVSHMLLEKLAGSRADFVFHGAANAAAGLDLARQLQPQIVLVDLHLPDADGIDLAQRLRAMPGLERSSVIAISASSMPHDVEAAERAGFSGYWVKPIHVPRMLGALQTLLQRDTAQAMSFAAISAMHRVSYGGG